MVAQGMLLDGGRLEEDRGLSVSIIPSKMISEAASCFIVLILRVPGFYK